MPASHWGRFPLPVAKIPPHPCAAYVGRQEAKPHCRCVPSTALRDRVRLQESHFRSHGIQRHTATEDRALSRAKHQRRHPRLAELVWPCSVSDPGKEMITHFCILWLNWIRYRKLHSVAQFLSPGSVEDSDDNCMNPLDKV